MTTPPTPISSEGASSLQRRRGLDSCARFGSTIAGEAETGEAEQHHRPCRRFWDAGRQREEVAGSHYLPSIVDAAGKATGETWQAPQVDNLAPAPFGGVIDSVDK